MNLQPALEKTKELLKKGELTPLTVKTYYQEKTKLITDLLVFHCTLHLMKPAEIEEAAKKLNSQTARVDSMRSIYIVCQN
jgi:hypothetical protein